MTRNTRIPWWWLTALLSVLVTGFVSIAQTPAIEPPPRIQSSKATPKPSYPSSKVDTSKFQLNEAALIETLTRRVGVLEGRLAAMEKQMSDLKTKLSKDMASNTDRIYKLEHAPHGPPHTVPGWSTKYGFFTVIPDKALINYWLPEDVANARAPERCKTCELMK